jgi:hypothetical protein
MRPVCGEGFAVDASLIVADANKQRSIPGAQWNKQLDAQAVSRATKEYRLRSIMRHLGRQARSHRSLCHDPIQPPKARLTDGDGEIVFEHACKLGCEGIVSKRLGSTYRLRRVERYHYQKPASRAALLEKLPESSKGRTKRFLEICFTFLNRLPVSGYLRDHTGQTRSGRSPHWLKIKNPRAPAATREAEEDW